MHAGAVDPTEVHTPTFTAADGRRLEVLIDRAHLTPLVPGSE